VDLVDDKHLVLAYLRRYAGLFHEGLDLLDAIVAGGIQLKDVEGTLLIERLATFTLVASLTVFTGMLAVDGLGENTGTGCLAHTTWTTEKVGVSELSALHGILQSRGQSTLSYYGVEAHRTVLSCRNNVFFHYFFLNDDAKITKKYYLCKKIRK